MSGSDRWKHEKDEEYAELHCGSLEPQTAFHQFPVQDFLGRADTGARWRHAASRQVTPPHALLVVVVVFDWQFTIDALLWVGVVSVPAADTPPAS